MIFKALQPAMLDALAAHICGFQLHGLVAFTECRAVQRHKVFENLVINRERLERWNILLGRPFFREELLVSAIVTWNLKMMVSNRNLLFQGADFQVNHVKLPGCTVQLSNL